MAFLYSAIGDNTIENREHLEKLGYTMSMVTMDKAIYLKTQANRKYYETNNDDWSKVITNCIGNPLLFQAVTAVRSDSNIGKWFHLKENANVNTNIHIQPCYKIMYQAIYEEVPNIYREATLEELINHFNSK